MHVSQTNMDIQLLIDSEDILYNIAKRHIYIYTYIYIHMISLYMWFRDLDILQSR